MIILNTLRCVGDKVALVINRVALVINRVALVINRGALVINRGALVVLMINEKLYGMSDTLKI